MAAELEAAERRVDRLGALTGLLKGNKLVEFVAEAELREATNVASARLSRFSRGNFGLELDANQDFVIRDDFSGADRRPLTSLSGGETFLASLSMALALAERFQARGTRPIRFFFLDEGFGSLDGEKLDQAIKALEEVAHPREGEDGGPPARIIGVISHIDELKARIPRALIVSPATPQGDGSTVAVRD